MNATDFKPILSIPEGTAGKYRIKHLHYPAKHVFHTSTFRTTLIGGQADHPIAFRKAVRFHQLSGPTGVWMTDEPVEQAQANRVFHDYRGHVLVGGLGLGYAATRIAERPAVRHVTIVELSTEVIQLVAPFLPRRVQNKITVVPMDLIAYLKERAAGRYTTEPVVFDRAFYDIWQSDGERTFFDTVVPLLQLSAGVVQTRPDCWNEDVMRGQLKLGLHARVMNLALPRAEAGGPHAPSLDEMCTLHNSIWWDWSVPFFKWYRAARPTSAQLATHIEHYAEGYGLLGFTQMWEELIARAKVKITGALP